MRWNQRRLRSVFSHGVDIDGNQWWLHGLGRLAVSSNMSNSLSYIIEKFDQAVYALATGEGDARSRVDVAFHCFWHIPVADLPESVREDREKITALLTRLGGQQGYIIPNNLRRMKNSTASEIAGLIHGIHRQLLAIRSKGRG
jgi:hypothetical protein